MTENIPDERDATRPRARLARYGLWQLRDYLIDRGAPTFIISFLLGYLTVAPLWPRVRERMETVPGNVIAQHGSAEQARSAIMAEFNAGIAGSILGALVFLGALMAMNGIVANDRKSGNYRFLFSKPVSPPSYYGQAFLVHCAGYLMVILALDAVYGVILSPILTVPRFISLALVFLCYAGIAFLLSAAARWDWLGLVAVTMAVSYLWDTFKDSASPAAMLLYLLPPLHRTSEVYRAAATGDALPWHSLEWIAGYGILCFIGGLVVLRYRRLAIV